DAVERTARRMRALGQGLIALGTAALLAAATLWVLGVTGVLTTPGALTWALAGGGVPAVLAGVVVRVRARRRRRAAGAERAGAYLSAVTEELHQVVVADLIDPTSAPLAEHDRVRAVLTAP